MLEPTALRRGSERTGKIEIIRFFISKRKSELLYVYLIPIVYFNFYLSAHTCSGTCSGTCTDWEERKIEEFTSSNGAFHFVRMKLPFEIEWIICEKETDIREDPGQNRDYCWRKLLNVLNREAHKRAKLLTPTANIAW